MHDFNLVKICKLRNKQNKKHLFSSLKTFVWKCQEINLDYFPIMLHLTQMLAVLRECMRKMSKHSIVKQAACQKLIKLLTQS